MGEGFAICRRTRRSSFGVTCKTRIIEIVNFPFSYYILLKIIHRQGWWFLGAEGGLFPFRGLQTGFSSIFNKIFCCAFLLLFLFFDESNVFPIEGGSFPQPPSHDRCMFKMIAPGLIEIFMDTK
jgi:hypothetical protein